MIKIERFWEKKVKDVIKNANDSIKKGDVDSINVQLNDIFNLVKDTSLNSQIRVSLCFALEKLANFEQIFNEVVEFFINLLENEEDVHVKEFSVFILGNLVIKEMNLKLITKTLPIFINFCQDSSEHVKAAALDIRSKLDSLKEIKTKEKETIEGLKEEFSDFIEEKIRNMEFRANEISSEALSLDYEGAFKSQDEMIKKIHLFSDKNEELENEISKKINEISKKHPIFQGEYKKIYSRWKTVRDNKENLIRQVHCIIRIQSKIYKIITFIQTKTGAEGITIEDIRKHTIGGRGSWSDLEIIETLKRLVDEEIVPNLFLGKIEDIEADIKKKNELETKKN